MNSWTDRQTHIDKHTDTHIHRNVDTNTACVISLTLSLRICGMRTPLHVPLTSKSGWGGLGSHELRAVHRLGNALSSWE